MNTQWKSSRSSSLGLRREAMLNWAKKCNASQLEEDITGRLNNVGLATVQNLRMCLGIDTVKPDVHIINALK